MARIRTIKPKFWDDLKLSKVSRDARLTFIGLWTFSDDLGVVIGEPIWLKSKIFPFDQIPIQQFDKWLNELAEQGFIVLFSYKEEKFFHLLNLTKHQVINRPNYEEVNVPANDLNTILNRSLNDHGKITEQSVQEGKGKEGKGKEGRGRGEAPPPPVDEFSHVVLWMEQNAPDVLKMQEPLTSDQYETLKASHKPDEIARIIQEMHNWPKLLTRKSAFITFNRFVKQENEKKK